MALLNGSVLCFLMTLEYSERACLGLEDSKMSYPLVWHIRAGYWQKTLVLCHVDLIKSC
jgi:hypothetical protein